MIAIIKIRDYMSKNVITIEEGRNIAEAVDLMDKYNIGSIVVIKEDKPLGILTERDIIRKVIAKKADARKILVKDVMSRDIKTLDPEISILKAVKLMDENNFRHMIIMENGKLVGILTAKDLIKMTSY